MAKKKESDTACDKAPKKKLQQPLKARRKKETVNGAGDAEEPIKRKVQSKSRSSAAAKTDAEKTSKYFSPVKKKKKEEKEKEEESDEDEFMEVPQITDTEPKAEVKEEDDESEDDWEEVEELEEPLGPVDPSAPTHSIPESVEIEIETPEARKRKKQQAEWEAYLRRMVNRYKKDLLIDTHKVHLLCLVANAQHRNSLCSDPDLLAITLSLLPAHFGNVSKERIDQNYLSGLHKWFKATFTLNPSLSSEDCPSPRSLLERRLASLSAKNHQEMTHLFLLVLRSLQLFCRLVLSLQPVPFKPPSTAKAKGSKSQSKTNSQQNSVESSPTEPQVSPGSKRPSAGEKKERGGKKAKKKLVKSEEEEEEEEEEEKKRVKPGQRPKNSKRRSVASKVSYKEESESDGGTDGSEEEFRAVSEEDSEEEEEEKKTKKKSPKDKKPSKNKTPAPKRRSGGKKQDKEQNHDEDDEEASVNEPKKRRQKDSPGADEWIEVYLDKPQCWVCVEVDVGVAPPQVISQNATQPLTYVISVNGDGFLKDLGSKYDPTWMTSSRKRRVDDEWWEESLEPFLGPEDERGQQEDKELQSKLRNKPLPVSITEYKNHPLYALKRHLLKYEAIYPETATVLGYCRGEPVYSRDCVHTLHSRDTWLKEARTVRLGEEPYKMVKGFSNRSRKARMMSENKNENDLALFGEWQTEEYQPPIAVDGKVPRNDYGNVYLFKPCMLPVGCVHLKLTNLNRVARKLNLDAAPAVTGFDFHGGYSHAVTDGYIVCEEHEEILRAAWVEEQEIYKQKEKEKREKKAISNWTLLTKGLLIRERLKRRYGPLSKESKEGPEGEAGGFSSDEDHDQEELSPKEKTASEALALSWPQNRQTEEEETSKTKSKRSKKGQEKHLFPFEKV
ncbi:DNA repair protein complementing XP-C cells [Boleophthalmus pectinirostris]|uniref:DNA repair protein complementing XP-C cells n=1 Tax=Boleophthalmus pectinirostris TaxID=150288 RepID=UPI00242ABDF9|nr:DNA repair protein complementing XP-C cells [Boleophthalmus pectinirostris]